ncbi:hypothetical protein BSNK01_25580 [Bacillaceae bacterium]
MYSDREIQRLTQMMHEFLFSIYEAIEQVYGNFGEIGIDFGLDRDGKLWFIEPNSKSAKVSLMKAYDAQTVRRAFLNPLNYAKYLYEQAKKKTKNKDKARAY